MANFITNTGGVLSVSTEYTEGASWAPETGYIVAGILEGEIVYYGAEDMAGLLDVAMSNNADESVVEANVVAWLKSNVGPVFNAGVAL